MVRSKSLSTCELFFTDCVICVAGGGVEGVALEKYSRTLCKCSTISRRPSRG